MDEEDIRVDDDRQMDGERRNTAAEEKRVARQGEEDNDVRVRHN